MAGSALLSRTAGPFQLSKGQQAALEHLLAAITSGKTCALQGPAGTGKTTLTRALWKELQGRGYNPMAASPTHKAAAALKAVLPPDAEVLTVAGLLRLKPQQQGRLIVFKPDSGARRKQQRLDGFDVLVVDEASMVSQALADPLEALCKRHGIALVMVGDPCQLPPVDVDPASPGGMCQQFTEPPGGVALLSEVVRHQGPVLALATAIREASEDLHQAWPKGSTRADDSAVVVHPFPSGWMEAAAKRIADAGWDSDPDRARVVCWSNRACHQLGSVLRGRRYGADAQRGWIAGEIAGNGEAIQQPGEPFKPPMAPASGEWRVLKAIPEPFERQASPVPWSTPTGLPRVLEIKAAANLHRLTLEPITGQRTGVVTCWAELPGSTEWGQQLAELAKRIRRIPAEQGDQRRRAWAGWHDLKSWVADIRPASVLTVHRSQGSTFREVFVAGDLRFCTGPEAQALHYVAVSRASQAVHLIGRG